MVGTTAGRSNPHPAGPPSAEAGAAFWPGVRPYTRHLLLRVAGVTEDAAWDPEYENRARAIRNQEGLRAAGRIPSDPKTAEALDRVCVYLGCGASHVLIGSAIVAERMNGGASPEETAEGLKAQGCAAVLSGGRQEERDRLALIRQGILPIVSDGIPPLSNGDFLLIEEMRTVIERAEEPFVIRVLYGGAFEGRLGPLTEEEKQALSGS